MRYYSEGQILRLEIYKKISENFPDEAFPSLKIASYFRRGRLKDDGILAILGVFYVILGIFSTYYLISGNLYDLDFIVRLQLILLILPILLSTGITWYSDVQNGKDLYKRYPFLKNNQESMSTKKENQ
jgi:hypothetical protein